MCAVAVHPQSRHASSILAVGVHASLLSPGGYAAMFGVRLRDHDACIHGGPGVQVYGFSSAKKMASVLVNRGDGTLRLYNKGASEWVLDVCTHMHDADGSVVPFTAARKAELLATVTEMASRGLRTLVRPAPSFHPGTTCGGARMPPLGVKSHVHLMHCCIGLALRSEPGCSWIAGMCGG